MEGTRERYQRAVQELLTEYAQIPYLQETLVDETIFDEESGRFLLVTLGWQNGERVNTIILHLDIIEEQVWIQCNNTDQNIADELVRRGVSRHDIILPELNMPLEGSPQPSIGEIALA